MNSIKTGALALLFAGVVMVPQAHAQSSSVEEMLSIIQNLMEQIEELQERLNQVRGEVRETIKAGLSEGTTDEDVRKIQELLATDPTLYPEGLVTGYFGPLTREALKRFQTRHELQISGQLNNETRELLEEYLGEKFGDRIPPGLLRAPGIQKKVELRIKEGCDNGGRGKAFLCNKLKIKYGNDDEDESESEDFDVTVSVEDGTTTVAFTMDDDDYEVVVDSTTAADVLAAVAEELDMDVEDLDEELVDEIEDALEDALEDATDDFGVTVSINDGTTTVAFTYDNDAYEVSVDATDEETVLEAVAEELDMDVEDLDDELEDQITDALEDALEDED